jgi:hypothetical protein
MKTCPGCEAEIAAEATTCPHCGAEMAAEATDWRYTGLSSGGKWRTRVRYALILAFIIAVLMGLGAAKYLPPVIPNALYPVASGTVTSVHGSSYTVTTAVGGMSGTVIGPVITVNATSSTTYVNPDDTATSASAVKVGTCISIWTPRPPMANEVIIGLWSDGTTLTADYIRIYSYHDGTVWAWGENEYWQLRGVVPPCR